MILFARQQDDVMSHMLEEALGLYVDELRQAIEFKDEARWRIWHPLAGRCFTTETAFKTAQHLAAIAKEPDYYRVNDYHWLILYECLEEFCELFNDAAQEEPGGFYDVGPYAFREIDFEDLVERFFWDTDFLMPFRVVGGLRDRQRQEMGLDEHLFGIAQGWAPHPEDLQVEHLQPDDVPDIPGDPLVHPGSTHYPDPRDTD
ncbi:MAG: hypothetical protein JXA57_21110 [Armatimonadetes bacterium]|nr:hypothetical protein [Armatimonadota bacterium]